jgi:hypothetical protein
MQMTFAKRLTPFMKSFPFTDDKSTLRDVAFTQKIHNVDQWLGIWDWEKWIWVLVLGKRVKTIMMRCKYETYYF